MYNGQEQQGMNGKTIFLGEQPQRQRIVFPPNTSLKRWNGIRDWDLPMPDT